MRSFGESTKHSWPFSAFAERHSTTTFWSPSWLLQPAAPSLGIADSRAFVPGPPVIGCAAVLHPSVLGCQTQGVESRHIKRFLGTALVEHGFVRAGSRWQHPSEDLLWTVEIEKSPTWSRYWSVTVMVVPLEHKAVGSPTMAMEIDYRFLSYAVPVALADRYPDHGSFALAALHLDSDLPDTDRQMALAFIARDLKQIVTAAPRLQDLAELVRQGRWDKGFVGKDIRRELLVGRSPG